MAFNWEDFLKVARYLKDNPEVAHSTEAALRTAIGRAYFAAFCHAREHARVRLRYCPYYDGRDHKKLREHFQIQGRIKIAGDLEQLKLWRNDADYSPAFPPNIELVVQSAVARAEGILNDLP